jgi:ATP-dependent DNA helicase RecG
MLSLHKTPVTELKGVGAKLAEKLAHIQINNLQDLLFHLPLRYQDRTRISPMGQLLPGDDVVVEGVIKSSKILFGKRRSLQVRIQDHTGTVSLRFFHFNAAQKNSFVIGSYVRAYGEARRGASGLELYHPEYEVLEGDSTPLQDKLTPVYPTTEGLHQNRIRVLIDQALIFLHQGRLEELLPSDFLHQQGLPSLEEAVSFLHHPSADASVDSIMLGQHPAQHRLAFE